jgi:hypothetical protein
MLSINLTDHFLIAMPAMDDPYFSKSLIYIAEHNDQGALGIIVNRPINMNLATLFEKIDVPFESGGTNRSRLRSASTGRRMAIDAGGQSGRWPDQFARCPAGRCPPGATARNRRYHRLFGLGSRPA